MKFIKSFFAINWLFSLFFNFKYFSLNEALKFPVLFYGRVSVHNLGGNVTIKGSFKSGMIKIGKPIVGIFDRKLSTVLNIHGDLIFGGEALLGSGCAISIGPGSFLSIGNNLSITGKSSLISSGKSRLEIGDHCLFSWDVLIMTSDFHNIKIDDHIVNSPSNVTIGNCVWIGTNVIVLKGANIPIGAVIGAGSVISKKLINKNAIYAGNPAKELKSNISWEK